MHGFNQVRSSPAVYYVNQFILSNGTPLLGIKPEYVGHHYIDDVLIPMDSGTVAGPYSNPVCFHLRNLAQAPLGVTLVACGPIAGVYLQPGQYFCMDRANLTNNALIDPCDLTFEIRAPLGCDQMLAGAEFAVADFITCSVPLVPSDPCELKKTTHMMIATPKRLALTFVLGSNVWINPTYNRPLHETAQAVPARDSPYCKLCPAESNLINAPCGHRCVCEDCFKLHRLNHCMACLRYSTGHIRATAPLQT